MNIIVLQHIKIEDPGYIKDLMLADGFNLTTIELDEGEKIPDDLSKFDGMFCMGGPMDTYMEQEYPWLMEEKKSSGILSPSSNSMVVKLTPSANIKSLMYPGSSILICCNTIMFTNLTLAQNTLLNKLNKFI